MTNAIIADQLTYAYNQVLAVDHISFQVAEGEILSFLGPNGAGKTTTVKMLTGQLHPQEGEATLMGLDIVRDTERVQAQIGVCFEITNLYEQMSAEENLNLFARLFGEKDFDAGYAITEKLYEKNKEAKRGEYKKPISIAEIRSRKVDNSITPTAILEQAGFVDVNTTELEID